MKGYGVLLKRKLYLGPEKILNGEGQWPQRSTHSFTLCYSFLLYISKKKQFNTLSLSQLATQENILQPCLQGKALTFDLQENEGLNFIIYAINLQHFKIIFKMII